MPSAGKHATGVKRGKITTVSDWSDHGKDVAINSLNDIASTSSILSQEFGPETVRTPSDILSRQQKSFESNCTSRQPLYPSIATRT